MDVASWRLVLSVGAAREVACQGSLKFHAPQSTRLTKARDISQSRPHTSGLGLGTVPHSTVTLTESISQSMPCFYSLLFTLYAVAYAPVGMT